MKLKELDSMYKGKSFVEGLFFTVALLLMMCVIWAATSIVIHVFWDYVISDLFDVKKMTFLQAFISSIFLSFFKS